jgi:hypothetical protein
MHSAVGSCHNLAVLTMMGATMPMSANHEKSQTVCIIGAGPSGLTVAKNFAERGIPFECLEREADIGGIWNSQTTHGRVHTSTHMISSKRLTEFTDFRMPREYPHYPRHDQALAYLRSYASRFNLHDRIQLETGVERIEKNGSLWRVTTNRGGEPVDYAAVVIANGHHCIPIMPTWCGQFSGDVIHASAFKEPSILKDRRVLIVGAGNSGCDIAVEAAQHAASAVLSMRRGYYVMPKYLFGAPLDRCGATLDRWRLPLWLNRLVTRACLNVAVGPVSRYGLPRPDHRLLASHPIVNSQLLHVLGHRRLQIKPAVAAVEGTVVHFVDKTELDVDLIICATGYQIEFPFCDASTIPWDSHRPALFLNVFHPQYDDLFVAGLIQPNGGIWQLVDLQSQLIARFILAVRNQSRAADWFRKQKRNGADAGCGGLKYVDSPRHAVEVDYFRYQRRLQRMIAKFDRRIG